jgi:hypothetical protein
MTMADTTAEPTLYLTLCRRRPLLGWPAPATVPLLETRPFVGTLHALNAWLCAGWSADHRAFEEKDHG